ncbi:MAG: spore cortex-lytic enzyme [Clostridia bacterium]|nr:spore cortex-lytic enzyme [Clostridia bacterium]MDY4083311.1 spore cortex-lytic enzyme [Eubacteriales bacterium]
MRIVSIVLLVVVVVMAALLCRSFESEEVDAFALKQGSSGQQVRQIQSKLSAWGYYSGEVDGIYGSKTTEAVKNFQRVNGLKVDGIVGEETAAKIGIALTQSSSTNSSYNSQDVYLLAKCVYAESRGEPYTGQVAVAAVVLNRVRSSSFPNTIAGVIYQPYAFTAVADGQINLEPNQTAYNAVRDAMNGWDPTNGCLYYFNPATATSSWIWTREVKLTIGKHKFAV